MSRILIIDDEKAILKMLQKLLEREGYEVLIAHNGKEGLKLFQTFEVDLVITDLIMPEVEGIEVIGALKKDVSDVKIIAVSGGGIVDSGNYLQLAEQIGADLIFEKPIECNMLLEGIKDLLKE